MDTETVRIFSVFAQVFIGIAILYSGRVIARAQYTRSMQDAWNDFNKFALSDKDNIEVARILFGPAMAESSADNVRKVYMAFFVLNILQASYTGMKHGLMDKEYTAENFDKILKPLLSDEDIYALTQERGYHPEFKNLCKNFKDSLSSTKRK